jgi:hypothetical protein
MKKQIIIVVFLIITAGRLTGQHTVNTNQFMTAPATGELLVTLTDITRDLCPTNLRQGDREFGGAPKVTITAKLEISADGSGLIAVINFSALERGDGRNPSTWVTGEFRPRVYNAPAGMKITGMKPANISSSVEDRVGSDAGAEFGDCKEGMLAMASPGGLIKRILWVGDTGGNDVASSATDCRCDTKIESIEFNKVRITTARL